MKFFKQLLFFSSVPTTPKFCVDCRHFLPDPKGINRFAKCSQFPTEQRSDFLVTKEIIEEEIDFMYCSTARKFGNLCGEKAKKYLAAPNP
jgi:hypothetical protein